MNDRNSGFSDVLKQTLLVLAISTVTVAVAQPVFYLLSTTGIFEWSLLRFLLGSLYGMILGVGNFFAMALSLVLVTATAASPKEGKAKAQSTYVFRQLILVALAVVGCLIPVFHIVSVLGSLALTQLVITAYALIGNVIALKKNPLVMKKDEPQQSTKEGSEPSADTKEDE